LVWGDMHIQQPSFAITNQGIAIAQIYLALSN
jgi:hypothetical protein